MNKTSHAIVRSLLLGTSCLSVAGLLVGAAQAQPGGGQVVLGTATITDKGANSTVIDQKTGKAIINWNSFSIGAGGTVTFNQPNANAIALNRVLGGGSSSIYGNLLANGQVWIINQNGILFGKGSRINVGGLIATTADISDANFAAGNYSFSGGTGASVVNQGTIRTKNGGSAVLSGASVQNQGLIQADTGTVVLGGSSAFTVDFVGDGLLKYAITAPAGQADNGQTGVSNSGTIKAAGGHVIMTARAAASVQDAVVNNTGMISATSAKLENGEVVLDGGDGDVNAGGTIDASGAGRGQTGGSVTITGHDITVADNTNINVSGDAGGGSVRIGGDLHGEGTLPTAANTHIGHAVIRADATRTGNGGTLVVWSNGITDFSGIFSAKGGDLGGDGGFIETSGHALHISPDARVDTTAPKGQTGTWLLDPDTIVITAGEGTGTTLDSGGNLPLGTDPGQTDFVDPVTITNALATTNVTLQAATLLEVDDDVIYASPHALNLMSKGNIVFHASIQNTQTSGGGAVFVVAGWDGVTAAGAILTTPGSYGATDGNNGRGDILLDASVGNVYVGSASGTTTLAGFDTAITADVGGSAQLGYHGAGGGNINVYMTDNVTATGGSGSVAADALLGNGSLAGDVTGNITGNISIISLGQTNFQDGSNGNAWLGNSAGAGSTETGNVQVLTKSGFLGADFTASDLQGGNVFYGFTDATVTPLFVGGFHYTSPHDFTFAVSGSLGVTGGVQNAGSGAVTLVAGWDGHTVGTAAQIEAANAYGLNGAVMTIGDSQFENAAVGSAGGLTTILTGDLAFTPQTGFYTQVGYHGAGGGNIHVVALGNLTMDGGANAADYAMIGNGSLNGDVTGAVSGDIDIHVGGVTGLEVSTGLTNAWIGNASTAATGNSGNSLLVTGSFDGEAFGAVLASDLNNGDVTVALTDSTAPGALDSDAIYNSAHTLNLLFAGSAIVLSDIQNSGSGAINLIAGWDGHTFDTAHLLDAGVFGNNGGTVIVSSSSSFGTASVGTANGTLHVAGATVDVAASSGFAQIGFHGAGTGAIVVASTGLLGFSGTSATDYAQIGNGATFGSNATAGSVTLTAATLGSGGNGDIVATDLQLNQTGAGALGAPGAAIQIAATTLALQAQGNAYLSSATGLALAGINTSGGSFNLSAGGDVTQSAGITAGGLNVSTTAGAITLTDLGNAVSGVSRFASTGATTFYDTLGTSVGASSVGGDLTLLSKGSVDFVGSVQSNIGAITVVAGWDGATTAPGSFGTSGVFGNGGASVTVGGTGTTGAVYVGSKSGATSLYASDVNVTGANANAQLGFHGAGGGAITVRASNNTTLSNGSGSAMIGNGSLGTDVTGSVTGDIDIRTTNAIALNGSPGQTWIGNKTAGTGTETGNLLVLAGFSGGNQGSCALACFAQDDIVGGDVTIGVTSTADTVISALSFTSAHTFTVLSGGAIAVTGMVQNAGTGAINVVAGWDTHTLSPSSFGIAGVFGNGGKGVTIGGSPSVTGNLAIGSAGGTTSIYGASLTLNAATGFAQLGFNGHGTGAIVVDVTGAVTLTGGGANGQFAQIGNGGLGTSGSNGGDIQITAGGDVTLTSGAGTEAYVQIGHGGAETNAGSSGYSNTADIAVTGANVLLNAGTGAEAYVQIGNGGYKSGAGLTGTATNSGDITITSSHTVALNGNLTTGANAYVQIGNGGSQSNQNAAATARGTDSGDIVITAPNGTAGSVTMVAGIGDNAYAQIGNGGYAANAGATTTVANFTISGDLTVTDLALTGGNGTGGNEYAQIGNGDASRNSAANVSGDISINANGQVTFTNGTGQHSPATIGNFTGLGTTSGTVTGAAPPSQVTPLDPVIIAVVAGNTADNNNNNGDHDITTINTTVIPKPDETAGGATNVPGASTASAKPGALASLDNGGDSSTPNTSDSATTLIADSLNGARPSGSQSIIAGVLRQAAPASHTVHGVPPADQDFSSWGNEALWQ